MVPEEVEGHLIDNGSSGRAEIHAKDALILSYESALRSHCSISAEEQREYKTRIQQSKDYYSMIRANSGKEG